MYPRSPKFLLSSHRGVRFWGMVGNLPGLLVAHGFGTCPVCSFCCQIREDGLVPECCGMLRVAESSSGASAGL